MVARKRKKKCEKVRNPGISFGGIPDYVLTIGVETQVEEADTLHEPLRPAQFTLSAEKSLDELNTGVLAELGATLLGARGFEHGLFAGLEKFAELFLEAFAGVDEVLDDLPVLPGPNPFNAFFCTLHLSGQLNEEQPQLTGHVGDGG